MVNERSLKVDGDHGMSSADASEMLVIVDLNNVKLAFSSSHVEEIFKIRSFYRSPFHDSPLLGLHVRNDDSLIPLFDLKQIIFSEPINEFPKQSKISMEPKGMECLVVRIKDSKIGLVCDTVRTVLPKKDLTKTKQKEISSELTGNLTTESIRTFLKDPRTKEMIIEVDLSKLLPIEELKSTSDLTALGDEDEEDFDISQYTLPS